MMRNIISHGRVTARPAIIFVSVSLDLEDSLAVGLL